MLLLVYDRLVVKFIRFVYKIRVHKPGKPEALFGEKSYDHCCINLISILRVEFTYFLVLVLAVFLIAEIVRWQVKVYL